LIQAIAAASVTATATVQLVEYSDVLPLHAVDLATPYCVPCTCAPVMKYKFYCNAERRAANIAVIWSVIVYDFIMSRKCMSVTRVKVKFGAAPIFSFHTLAISMKFLGYESPCTV